MKSLNLIKKLLTKKQLKKVYLLFFIMFIAALLEMMSIGLILPIANFFLEPSESNYFSTLITKMNLDINTSSFLIISMSFVLIVFFLKNAFLLFLTWVQIKFMSNIKATLADRLFEWYLLKSYFFHIGKSKAYFIRNCQQEIDVVLNNFLAPVLVISLNFVTILFIISLLFFYNFFPTLIVLLVFGSTAVILNRTVKSKLRSIGLERQSNQYFQLKYLQEALGGIKEVKIYGSESYFLNLFNLYNYKFAKLGVAKTVIGALPRQIFELLFIFCIFTVVLITILIGENLQSLVPLLAVYALSAFRILPSLNSIATSYQKMKFAGPALELLSKEISEINENKIEKKVNREFTFNKSLEIKNVSFSYDENKKILDELNLTINKSSIIGITGSNGSGKSTLINLICGLLKPNAGTIKIDNKNIDVNFRSWFNFIGYVSQSTYMIDDTILSNIAFGVEKSKIDMKKVNNVLAISQLKETIESFPNHLNTIAGEDGINLSGGQKQKISIARALYKNSEIIIFDEPTSAMDLESEKNFIKSFLSKDLKKTIIIVTHEPDLLKSCDNVYELNDGKLEKKTNFF